MKCPDCGAAELVREARDVPFTYKGQTLTVPLQPGLYCPACGEAVYDAAEIARFEAITQPFIAAINGGEATQLREWRKRLGLTQLEAANLFGGGPNAFSRYESGKVQPPLALVKLAKLLSNHPDLLDEVR